ncbi:MAG: GDP-L-fucose synthase [Zetaproteobacteria bacterium]|nr:GDP-L-fucose synthase [Zetaproteobacteria bacterium]
MSVKIYIAGHRGMVGSAIVRQLEANKDVELIIRTHAELDLTHQQAVNQFFAENAIDQVYLAAAKVGGIHANNEYPAEFIYENLMIEANIIHAAHANGVRKLLFLGSSCIYPKLAAQPMAESSLLTDTLEATNEPYAIAKIAGIKLCESYNRQYGRDYRSVMPTNLYGENDNFHPENSHVIPALMRRFHLARLAQDGDIEAINTVDQRNGKISDADLSNLCLERVNGNLSFVTSNSQSPTANHESPVTVSIWGSGTPMREFLFVDDMAAASIYVMNLDHETYQAHTQPMLSHINVGTGIDCTIRELAETMADVVGFKGELVFDATKPDGAPRKLMDVSRLEKLGWKAGTGLKDGLATTYQWFLDHQEDFRK